MSIEPGTPLEQIDSMVEQLLDRVSDAISCPTNDYIDEPLMRAAIRDALGRAFHAGVVAGRRR